MKFSDAAYELQRAREQRKFHEESAVTIREEITVLESKIIAAIKKAGKPIIYGSFVYSLKDDGQLIAEEVTSGCDFYFQDEEKDE